MNEDSRISRRSSLLKIGGLLAGAAAAGGWKAADSPSATDEESSSAGPAGVASGAPRTRGSCAGSSAPTLRVWRLSGRSIPVRAPYSRRPNRNTRNAADSIFRNGGSRSLLTLRKSGARYIGSITLGVQRS